jgi:hypothetical protein
MVDRHRRDDDVEAPERGQRPREVVLDELDAVVAREAPARRLEHELGEVKSDAERVGPVGLQQGEQATVAGPEVEDATNIARDLLGQDALALRAVRNVVRPGEIAVGVLDGCPFLGRDAGMLSRPVALVGDCAA